MRYLKFLIAVAATAICHSPVGAADRVTFGTDWRAQAEHGGFYQALAKGLYKARVLYPKDMNWRAAYITRFLEPARPDR